MHPLLNARRQGVRTPENQSNEQAPTMTVTNISRLEVVLVEWGNERGQKETSIGVIINGKVFVPPQYASWTDGFRPLAEVLSKQAMEKLETQSMQQSTQPPVPTSDEVDVTGDIK